jgi:ABC-type multidrug transport system fused ATPase/permease subunit
VPAALAKSTIAMLLLRFIEPQSGVIYIGERQLQDIPASFLAYAGSLGASAAPSFSCHHCRKFADWQSQVHHSLELRRAAKLAYLDDWIAGCPWGMIHRWGRQAGV